MVQMSYEIRGVYPERRRYAKTRPPSLYAMLSWKKKTTMRGEYPSREQNHLNRHKSQTKFQAINDYSSPPHSRPLSLPPAPISSPALALCASVRPCPLQVLTAAPRTLLHNQHPSNSCHPKRPTPIHPSCSSRHRHGPTCSVSGPYAAS